MKLNNIFKIAGLSSMLLIGSTGCEDFLTKDLLLQRRMINFGKR